MSLTFTVPHEVDGTDYPLSADEGTVAHKG